MSTGARSGEIGELFRLNGKWGGKQIVSEVWVKASVTPDAPHLMPGDTGLSDSVFGYGYQWWVPEGNEGEYSAIGVYNQFVYVNPTKRVVIVKLSANRRYGLTNDETSYRELETIAFLRAIVAAAQECLRRVKLRHRRQTLRRQVHVRQRTPFCRCMVRGANRGSRLSSGGIRLGSTD